MSAFNFSILVPGHGPVQRDGSALTSMHRYFSQLQNEVRLAIKEQVDLAIASETLFLKEAANWKLFEEFHKRNVIAAYTELEWE